MKIKYSSIAMSRNKYSSFRTAERVWKTLFIKANVTVLLLVLINNVNISRLNRIGRQLQPVELAAGELAVNWQTTSAWFPHLCIAIHLDRQVTSVSRLSEIRMFTVVSLETLNFKAVMNKQRINATELLLYLWLLVLSVDSICSVCFSAKWRH